MKLGIMQPYFFPYIGHFSLIANTEKWVVFDIVQYKPKSWMSRNRILHPVEGWQYISVPLSNSSQSIKICEATVLNLENAKARILGQIDHYRKKAPYFEQARNIINNCFESTETDSLCELNVNSLRVTCDYLGIPFDFTVCSAAKFSLPPNLGPGDWALEICSILNADEYLNPTGGYELFDERKFIDRSIKLSFLRPSKFTYDCGPYKFEDGLSIVDVLMWSSPEEIRKALLSPLVYTKKMLSDGGAN